MQRDTIYRDTMGIPFIPFTFPTVKVKRYINENWGLDWTNTKVDNLYQWYKEAVAAEGLPAYVPGTGSKLPTIEYVAASANATFDEVQIFLDSLRDLVKAGEVENQYLAIEKPTTAATSKIKTALTDVTDIAKKGQLFAMLIAGGIGLFFLWPYLKRRKR